MYIAWRAFLSLLVFGVFYVIAKFAGSNTPFLIAFMMWVIYGLGGRINEQEKAMVDLRERYDEHLERIYNALDNADDKIERKFDRAFELYEKTLPPKHIDDDYF